MSDTRKKFDLSSLIDLDEDLWPIVREELRAMVGDEKYNAFVKLLTPSPDKPDPLSAIKELVEAFSYLLQRADRVHPHGEHYVSEKADIDRAVAALAKVKAYEEGHG